MDTPDYASPRQLPKQFLVTHKRIEPPPDWRSTALGDRLVYTSPELPVTNVTHTSSEKNAACPTMVLGWFSVNDQFYPNPQNPILRADTPIENLYHQMTGRFIVLCAGPTGLRCITDPGALLPLVFRLDTDEVASTPAALSLTAPVTRSASTNEDFRRADSAVWYPFGVTPFSGIQRALPGSILELPSGRIARVAQPPSLAMTDRDIVKHIHLRTRKFVEALSKERTIECHLTAGWDSRMVLSASMGTTADIQYLTYKAPGTNGSIDCLVAQRISRSLSLRHKEIALLPARQRDIDGWAQRTSGCIRDSVMSLTTTVTATYTGRYVLCGLAGEVGRAFYWRARDIEKYGLDAEGLLDRLGFRRSKPAIEAAERWLQDIDVKSRTAILDQAYIDLRLGGWAGPSLCGHPVDKPSLSPFNNSTIFSLMRMLPDEYRQSGEFAKDFVSLGSPGLAQIPVNRAAGMKRLRYIRREIAATLPKRLKTSLRALGAH